MTPRGVYLAGRESAQPSGTEGSNPLPSNGESRANLSSLKRFWVWAKQQVQALIDELTQKRSLDDDLRNRMHAALKEYKANFTAQKAEAVTA